MGNALLSEIKTYWTHRSSGYSKVNQDELNGCQKANWSKLLVNEIHKQFTYRMPEDIKVLDIGCGPGFFSIILAELGYQVTAVDYTEAMIGQAKQNAGNLADDICFLQMDAQDLQFADCSFDVVVSRNLTWNLEHPKQAYASWCRVMKKGGILLNFDANWYGYLYDEEKRAAYERDRSAVEESGMEDHYTCTDIDTMEAIAYQMPLSPVMRPAWDVQVIHELPGIDVSFEENVGERLWSEVEKINYAATPMFMVRAVKE